MGTPFDFSGPRSHTDFPDLPRDIAGRGALLRDATARGGFAAYDKEWWHFTVRNEPFPKTTFDVPIR